jgi:hypothetical protein
MATMIAEAFGPVQLPQDFPGVFLYKEKAELIIGFPDYSRFIRKPRPYSFIVDRGTSQPQQAKRASLDYSWTPPSFPKHSVQYEV